MRTLRNYYLQGLVLYPRVENGYILDNLFSYFPHPELIPVNSYLEPLRENSYPLTDDSLLLHLHNLRYFNISNCESVQSFVKGKIKENKPNLTPMDKKLIDNYRFFLNKNDEIDFDYFLKKQITHYKEKKPTLLKIDYTKENFIEEILALKERIDNKNQQEDGIELFKNNNVSKSQNNLSYILR